MAFAVKDTTGEDRGKARCDRGFHRHFGPDMAPYRHQRDLFGHDFDARDGWMEDMQWFRLWKKTECCTHTNLSATSADICTQDAGAALPTSPRVISMSTRLPVVHSRRPDYGTAALRLEQWRKQIHVMHELGVANRFGFAVLHMRGDSEDNLGMIRGFLFSFSYQAPSRKGVALLAVVPNDELGNDPGLSFVVSIGPPPLVPGERSGLEALAEHLKPLRRELDAYASPSREPPFVPFLPVAVLSRLRAFYLSLERELRLAQRIPRDVFLKTGLGLGRGSRRVGRDVRLKVVGLWQWRLVWWMGRDVHLGVLSPYWKSAAMLADVAGVQSVGRGFRHTAGARKKGSPQLDFNSRY
ncbi:hypothetical protein R3P38DRAFT_3374741 [Favolaschia claudopus]|uniref:Uncharacterized protein n=1 Tax=Favolaschia claudopus TaxID=2862362 RepID=A0AAV9ZMG4_9AGAR